MTNNIPAESSNWPPHVLQQSAASKTQIADDASEFKTVSLCMQHYNFTMIDCIHLSNRISNASLSKLSYHMSGPLHSLG